MRLTSRVSSELERTLPTSRSRAKGAQSWRRARLFFGPTGERTVAMARAQLLRPKSLIIAQILHIERVGVEPAAHLQITLQVIQAGARQATCQVVGPHRSIELFEPSY